MNKDKLKELVKESRKDATRNVVSRGSVHFRLDPEMMNMLMSEANKVRVPFGVFARMLMIEALTSRIELNAIKATQAENKSNKRVAKLARKSA